MDFSGKFRNPSQNLLEAKNWNTIKVFEKVNTSTHPGGQKTCFSASTLSAARRRNSRGHISVRTSMPASVDKTTEEEEGPSAEENGRR